MNDTPISIRLDGKLRKSLEVLAAKDRRKLSDYIRVVLYEHVQDLYKASARVFEDHTPVPRKAGKK
jgi:predicted DNA-binding protein